MKYKIYWVTIGAVIVVSVLFASGCTTQAAGTPAIVTVVRTVPVEVTKEVEVTRAVEVTREVMVTQLVQVPVTPVAVSATDTPTPTATFVINLTPTTPQTTPEAKGTGYTPVFVNNQTSNKVGLSFLGPTTMSLTLWPGDIQKIWVLAGAYRYTVLINDQAAYSGSFKIVNPDKHQFMVYDNKAVLLGP